MKTMNEKIQNLANILCGENDEVEITPEAITKAIIKNIGGHKTTIKWYLETMENLGYLHEIEKGRLVLAKKGGV